MKTKDFFDKWIYPILVLDLKAKLCKTLIGSILYYLLIVGGFSAILFFRGVYIFWYPHSYADLWFSLLFNTGLLLTSYGLEPDSSSLPKSIQSTIILYLLKLIHTICQILILAVVLTLFFRPWMYDYSMSDWIFRLSFSMILIFGGRFGYLCGPKSKRAMRKKKAKASLKNNG